MSVASVVLTLSTVARADEKTEEDHAANQVRALASISTFSGRQLVGAGSVGRYRLGGGSVELDIDRFFGWIGFDIHIEGFPYPGQGGPGYFRGEAALGVLPIKWPGASAGGLSFFAGIGGDVMRYWYAEEGRFFGMIKARARWWPTKDVPIQLQYTVLPAAVSGVEATLHDHRLELASGWKFLSFGTRAGVVFAQGGDPERVFWQTELGAFVGFGLL